MKPLEVSLRTLGSKMQALKDTELKCWAKICILLKIQRCAMNDFFFAKFGMDFDGQYVADYVQN